MKLEIKDGLEAASDDIFHNINSLPIHIKHNLNSESDIKTLNLENVKLFKIIWN